MPLRPHRSFARTRPIAIASLALSGTLVFAGALSAAAYGGVVVDDSGPHTVCVDGKGLKPVTITVSDDWDRGTDIHFKAVPLGERGNATAPTIWQGDFSVPRGEKRQIQVPVDARGVDLTVSADGMSDETVSAFCQAVPPEPVRSGNSVAIPETDEFMYINVADILMEEGDSVFWEGEPLHGAIPIPEEGLAVTALNSDGHAMLGLGDAGVATWWAFDFDPSAVTPDPGTEPDPDAGAEPKPGTGTKPDPATDPSDVPEQPSPPIPMDETDLTDGSRAQVSVPANAEAGQQIQVDTGATNAGKTAEIWFHSEPTLLAVAVLDSAGSAQVALPADAPAGEHKIVVRSSDGALIGWDNISVTAAAEDPAVVVPDDDSDPSATPGTAVNSSDSATLPRTGAGDVTAAAGVALLLVLAGASILATRRRFRH